MRTWVFDIDGCLVDSLTGTSLRPGAVELLTQLRSLGDVVVAWSAGGEDYARSRLEQRSIAHLVDAFHAKVTRDVNGSYLADHVGGGILVFVDDRPEDLTSHDVVVHVSPYLGHNPHDRGLRRVADLAGFELFPA